jgi:predicted NBD/HSP70 family sugar kinase
MNSPMRDTSRASRPPGGSPGEVLDLVRSGAASSRSDVVRLTGLAPSTVSARIDVLLASGLLEEAGPGASRGGRRPRQLRVRGDAGLVGVADLGAHHASLGVLDLRGDLVAAEQRPMRIADGPLVVLPWLHEQLSRLCGEHGGQPLRGIAIGVPGPVEFATGRVVSPSRMPGWNGVDVPAVLAPFTDVPVLVENDANLMALGEHAVLGPTIEHLVFLKAGSGIGCGVVASSRLHRGARGAAGDISHIRVAGAEHIACNCGRSGCLDAVASGAALVRRMREEGVDIDGPEQLIELAGNADPRAARLLREAGHATGEVLASVVNFFNPEALVIGGQLSRAEPFVASLQSALYELCLPMATQDLIITVTKTGVHAGVLGAGRLILEHLFDPRRVDSTLEQTERV